MDESLTSFCGLCCTDCIPSHKEFFTLAARFGELLEELQFEQYAAILSEDIAEFSDYPKFLSVLNHIKELACPGPCRLGGGKPECRIKLCARSKDLEGCWQCQSRRECTMLNRLRADHPNLDYNLDLIAEMGPSNWYEKRKPHYCWRKPDEL